MTLLPLHLLRLQPRPRRLSAVQRAREEQAFYEQHALDGGLRSVFLDSPPVRLARPVFGSLVALFRAVPCRPTACNSESRIGA